MGITIEAFEVPKVCAVTSPLLSTDVSLLLCDKNYDAATQLHPDPWQPEEVSVLLGSDVFWKVATGRVHDLFGDLTVIKTKFGCSVQGTMERERSSAYTSALFLFRSTKFVPNGDLSAIWHLGVKEIKAPAEKNRMAPPELEASKQGIIKFDGCYKVPLKSTSFG